MIIRQKHPDFENVDFWSLLNYQNVDFLLYSEILVNWYLANCYLFIMTQAHLMVLSVGSKVDGRIELKWTAF